jgi:hypothetical protein
MLAGPAISRLCSGGEGSRGRRFEGWTIGNSNIQFKCTTGYRVGPMDSVRIRTHLMSNPVRSSGYRSASRTIELTSSLPCKARRQNNYEIIEGTGHNLTGAKGFEPLNGWTKTSCLTTWRRPNVSTGPKPALL